MKLVAFAQVNVKRFLILILIYALMASPVNADTNKRETPQREATICGAIKERLVFWLWSRMAPDPDPRRVSGSANIEAVFFVTGDGKKLSGYKFVAHDERGNRVAPQGYVLMALGNAMIADQMIRELSNYARFGYDAYIYDYRGYGLSEGKRRINAIIEDYREIVSDLNGKYQRKMLYGVSLGGMVMMNVIGSGVAFDAAVIDSSPSRLSDYGCPARIDPVNQLSRENAPRILVITGSRDQVLTVKQTQDLRLQAAELGASTYDGADFAHPYMDSGYDVHMRRVKMVQDYLIGRPLQR